MKLLIDAYNISLAHGTGVATYGRNLARTVAGLGHEVDLLFASRAGHSKVPLLNEIAIAEGAPQAGKTKSKRARPGIVLQAASGIIASRKARPVPISGQVILPQGLHIDGARYWNVPAVYSAANGAFRATGAFSRVSLPGTDIAHWTYPLPVKLSGARNVYTLHDLVPLRLPYATADVKRTYYRLCRRIARDADHILTVSECSRRDIIDILQVEESRVTNLYQTCELARHLDGVTEEELRRHVEGLVPAGMREYFLFFGAIEPKKNIARMIEAYLGSGSKSPLVIVGAPGWGSDRDVKLLKSMAALDKRKRIVWLGYLPREMLAMLIAGARGVVFPSLYEGFGLPVLESMSLGTPVITSTTSSLPEVAGDAALLVDPYDVRSITRAILEMDGAEGTRTDLARRGLQQAGNFSQAAYAERLAAFYTKLGCSGQPAAACHTFGNQRNPA